MWFAYLDASALVKRYAIETGTPSVNHLFRQLPPSQRILFVVGIGEVGSILVRKRNAGRLSATAFRQAWNDYLSELVTTSPVQKIVADEIVVARSLLLIERHSINSTDAIVLRTALDLDGQLLVNGDKLLLVASDQRLLRAAQAEGLTTFNPETQTEQDLDTLLGP